MSKSAIHIVIEIPDEGAVRKKIEEDIAKGMADMFGEESIELNAKNTKKVEALVKHVLKRCDLPRVYIEQRTILNPEPREVTVKGIIKVGGDKGGKE